MKILFKYILLSVLFLFISNNYLLAQNGDIPLRASDFVIGLENIDFLRERLNNLKFDRTDSGSNTRSGLSIIYEYWSDGIIDIRIFEHQNFPSGLLSEVQVVMHDVNNMPEKLSSGIEDLFPNKIVDKDQELIFLNGHKLYEANHFDLIYSRDDNIKVRVYYSSGEYIFQFSKYN